MANKSNGSTSCCDYLIIGAGPAGLQLGYYMEKEGLDYLILEAGERAGTFFKSFPRHRKLISVNKVQTGYDDPEINMRWDWNSLLSDDNELLVKNYTKQYFPAADDLVQYLADFAERYKLKIKYKTRVKSVSKAGAFKVIDDQGHAYSCQRLIIATGFSKPYVPAIPGIELAENYTDVSVDPDDFINQKVLVIGKGNSGFETAENLIPTAAVIHVASPSPISMAWKTHFVGHLRAINNNFLDTYQLKSQNAVIDASIEKISRRDGRFVVSVDYTHANGEKEDLIYDRVIVAAGFKMDDSIFDESCRPALVINNRFPDQTSEWESTSVKDLYFAGTLMQMRDWKKSTSGFIHGFRYNVRSLFRMFKHKYHSEPWPSRAIDATPQGVLDEVIKRVNASSALWQQFGFLCDLIVLPNNGGQTATYYEEMPVSYVHDSPLGKSDQYYIVTLEFGKVVGDPFNITRDPDPSRAERSVFLHPVIRHFAGPDLVAEHHVLEDLYGEWRKQDLHIKPLLEFFKAEMPEPTFMHAG